MIGNRFVPTEDCLLVGIEEERIIVNEYRSPLQKAIDQLMLERANMFLNEIGSCKYLKQKIKDNGLILEISCQDKDEGSLIERDTIINIAVDYLGSNYAKMGNTYVWVIPLGTQD